MADAQKKTRVLHFRLTEDDFSKINQQLKAAKLSASEFFREVFLNKKITFNVKEAVPKDYERLLFFYNKSSNNLNQMAHNINRASQRGVINQALYTRLLNELVSVRTLLNAGVTHADQS